jgi:hypothetical protein
LPKEINEGPEKNPKINDKHRSFEKGCMAWKKNPKRINIGPTSIPEVRVALRILRQETIAY